MSSEVRVWGCEVCGKRVSRLLGMAGAVEIAGGATRVLPVVRGYCSEHRSAVIEAYVGELASQGTIAWLSEPHVDLKPRHVDDFLLCADLALGSLNHDGAPARDAVSAACPHCGHRVSWGMGPHAADAAARSGTVAWVCPSCGAAGLAYLTT